MSLTVTTLMKGQLMTSHNGDSSLYDWSNDTTVQYPVTDLERLGEIIEFLLQQPKCLEGNDGFLAFLSAIGCLTDNQVTTLDLIRAIQNHVESK